MLESGSLLEGELGEDDQFPQLQSCGDDLLAELGQVVFVAVCDFFDETMQAQAFEQPGDLTAGFA